MSIQNFAFTAIQTAYAVHNSNRMIGGKIDLASWGQPGTPNGPVEELAPSLAKNGWLASVGPAPLGFKWETLPTDVQALVMECAARQVDDIANYNGDIVVVKDESGKVVWNEKPEIVAERFHNNRPKDWNPEVVCFTRNRTLFAAWFAFAHPETETIGVDVQPTWSGWDAVEMAQDAENSQPGRRGLSEKVQLSRTKWYVARGYTESDIRRFLGLKRGRAQKLYGIAKLAEKYPDLKIVERCFQPIKTDSNGKPIFEPGGPLNLASLDYQGARTLIGDFASDNKSYDKDVAALVEQEREEFTAAGKKPPVLPTKDTVEAFLEMRMTGQGRSPKVVMPVEKIKSQRDLFRGLDVAAPVYSVLQAICTNNADWFVGIKEGKDSYVEADEPKAQQPEAQQPKAEQPKAPAAAAAAAEAPAADPTDGGGKAKKGTRSRGSRATN
jgi:hypothetical protein